MFPRSPGDGALITIPLSYELEVRVAGVRTDAATIVELRHFRRRVDMPGAFEAHGGFQVAPDQALALASAIQVIVANLRQAAPQAPEGGGVR